MNCRGVDIEKIRQGSWEYESTGEHSRMVPKVTKSERDLLRELEARSDLQGPELWLMRELRWKIRYRDRFILPEVLHG